MKILVTGFEPFGGESVNPSWMAVERLPDTLDGAEIVKRRLPVVYFRALDILEKEIETLRPDVVVMTGQAGGSDAMRIERVGINLCEAKLPDNDGVQLMGAPIVPGGPNAYFSTFPYREMLAAVEEADGTIVPKIKISENVVKITRAPLLLGRRLPVQSCALRRAASGRNQIPRPACRLYPRPLPARADGGQAGRHPLPAPGGHRPGPPADGGGHRPPGLSPYAGK